MNAQSQARRISMHHLCALDVTHAELILLASRLQCDHVCVFTHVPEWLHAYFPEANDPAMLALMQKHSAETGVTVHNIEYFPIDEATDPDTFRNGFARGADLGAERAAVHINDPQRDRAIETFQRVCTIAGEYGLRIGLEFTHFSQVRSLMEANQIIDDAACDNADIVLDALHHFRSGGTIADIAKVAPTRIGYAQICDGPAEISEDMRLIEASVERGVPGTGDFPLQAFVDALPKGPVLDVEVPLQSLLDKGISPDERAGLGVRAVRALLGLG
jgi:sugar phosphate isomerase/epimerase